MNEQTRKFLAELIQDLAVHRRTGFETGLLRALHVLHHAVEGGELSDRGALLAWAIQKLDGTVAAAVAEGILLEYEVTRV